MATPVDNIMLPATQGSGQQVNISISCELMKHQQRASLLEPGQKMSVVQDKQGQPMIFSIGSDQHLRLVRYTAGVATDWQEIDLSGTFPGSVTASVSVVTQDITGKISIAVALKPAGASTTEVFFASMLSNDSALTNWSKFSTFCTRVSGLDPSFVAEKMLMGTSDDGQSPLLIVAGNIQRAEYYYQIDGPPYAATKFEFPENVSTNPNSLLDLSIGYAFGQRGIYFLYNIGETQTLECSTLATPDEGIMHYDYSPGNLKLPQNLRNLKYNCIATPTGKQSDPMFISSDIYVGSDSGLYLFKDARIASMQKVTEQIKDVHELIVVDDASNISIWALCSPNKLYYIYGKKGTTYSWHDPILFSSSAIHIAPMRNHIKKANELVVVNQDQSITHHWQDPASTLWQQRTLKMQDQSFSFDLNAFITQIHLEDQNSLPIVDQALLITASAWTYAEANGLIYSLDKDSAAEIKSDSSGTVTLINLASDIASPIFHVEASLFDKTLNIYPNAKIAQGLQAIKTGDDLIKARTSDNQPVLTQSYDAATLNGIASTLNQLASTGPQMASGTSNSPYLFVVVEDKGTKHTGQLSAVSRPATSTASMKVVNSSLQPQARTALSIPSASSIGSEMLSFEGDALQWVTTTFNEGVNLVENGVTYLKEGVSFVIHNPAGILTLTLNLVDKVLNIVLDSLGTLFKAINWILKLVGIDIAKILAWLGHLFGWDEIWKTHKIIASMMNAGLDYGIARVQDDLEQWRNGLDQFAGQIAQQIKSLLVPASLQQVPPIAQAQAELQQQPNVTLSTPPANWTTYQMQHAGLLHGALSNYKGNDPFSQFVNDVVVPTVKALLTDIEKDIQDLQRLITSGSVADVVKLLGDLVDTLIDPAKALFGGMLQFLADLLGDLKSLSKDPLHIPFLSDFYSWVTDLLGDGEELTFVNAVALLLAIPATIMCEIALGHAPFADSTYGLDSPNLFHALLGAPAQHVSLQVSAHPAAPQVMRLAAQSTASSTDSSTTTDSPEKTQRAMYSSVGGLFGAIAGSIATVLLTWEQHRGLAQPLPDPGEGRIFTTMEKTIMVLQACKCALTIPMPPDDQDHDQVVTFNLRIFAYLAGLMSTVASWRMPSHLASGVVTILADLIILGLSLGADGKSKAEVLNWMVDILSNAGGCIRGAGEVWQRQEALVAGAGLSVLGGVMGVIYAISGIAGKHIVYLVNVAGP